MAGRSGRRRVNSSSPLVDLDVVFADDEWLDGIATRPWMSPPTLSVVGAPHRFRTERLSAVYASATLLTRDPLTELFENWRDELALTPLPEPPRLGDLGGIGEPPKIPAKRSLRAALAIAAAIAALLVGTASISSKDATPNSALWPVATVFWPNRVASVESADRAKRELDLAQVALMEGRSVEAKLALFRATEALAGVEDLDGRDGIKQQVASMWLTVAPVVEQPATVTTSANEDRSQLPTVASPTAAGSSAAAVASSIAAPVIVAAAPAVVADGAGAGIPPEAQGFWPVTPNAGPAAPPSSAIDPVTDPEPVVVESPVALPSVVTPPPTEPPPSSTVEPPAASVPSTPPAPAEPPGEVPASDPPPATEQSAPVPAPSDGVPLGVPAEDEGDADTDASALDAVPVAATVAATGDAAAESAGTN